MRFFAARTEDLKREMEARRPFRSQFFTQDCLWESRLEDVERSATESILETKLVGSEALVITRPAAPFPQLRYHLSSRPPTWIITAVDIECLTCGGTGGSNACAPCQGRGWLEQPRRLPSGDSR